MRIVFANLALKVEVVEVNIHCKGVGIAIAFFCLFSVVCRCVSVIFFCSNNVVIFYCHVDKAKTTTNRHLLKLSFQILENDKNVTLLFVKKLFNNF